MSNNILAFPGNEPEPQPFEFDGQQIRVIQIDGLPWFVLADVCKVLDLANPSKVAADLDEDALTTSEVIDSLGRKQQANLVNEAGLYEVIFKSRKEEAKAFKRWVTKDVLPQIRANGSYGQPKVDVAQITKADLAQMILDSEKEKQAIAAQLEQAQPAIEYVQQYVGNDDAVTVENWAMQFGTTGPKAFPMLRELGIIRRVPIGDHWSSKKQRVVTDYEHRAIAGRKTYDWFTLRPQHNVPRHHNGQVRQTLYIRQAHALDLAKTCGLVSKEMTA